MAESCRPTDRRSVPSFMAPKARAMTTPASYSYRREKVMSRTALTENVDGQPRHEATGDDVPEGVRPDEVGAPIVERPTRSRTETTRWG